MLKCVKLLNIMFQLFEMVVIDLVKVVKKCWVSMGQNITNSWFSQWKKGVDPGYLEGSLPALRVFTDISLTLLLSDFLMSHKLIWWIFEI